MVAVSVQIIGLPALSLSMQRFQQKVHDPSDLLDQGAKLYYKETELRFLIGDSGGWPALSPRRVQERSGLSHPILRWTDDLYKAATGQGGLGYIGEDIQGYKSITPKRLKMSLEGDKVQHNFGFVNDEGFSVPRREFWTWDESDQDMFFEPFEKWADSWIAGP